MIRNREKNIRLLRFNFEHNKDKEKRKKNKNNMSKIIASTFNKKIMH